MTLTSNAQNFEDVLLWRALKDVPSGFYIDIGANDPLIDSVSVAFYDRGWRGVHVEPIARYAEMLRNARPDELVIEAAIGLSSGHMAMFEIPGTGLSTGCEDVAARRSAEGREVMRVDVKCLPLSEVLEQQRDRTVHWMKIDVEGMEVDVIESWLPSTVRPWIVVIEASVPTVHEPSHRAWEPQLVELGYTFAYSDGLNRYYISNEKSELLCKFSYGPSVFDDFALSETSPFVQTLANRFREKADEYEARADGLLERIAELEREVLAHREAFCAERTHWQTLLQQRELSTTIAIEELAAMRDSSSWKITAPMRSLSLATREGLRSTLEGGLVLVRRFPILKGPILAVANLAPPIRRKINHFVLVRPKLSQSNLPLETKPSRAALLDNRVREICEHFGN